MVKLDIMLCRALEYELIILLCALGGMHACNTTHIFVYTPKHMKMGPNETCQEKNLWHNRTLINM